MIKSKIDYYVLFVVGKWSTNQWTCWEKKLYCVYSISTVYNIASNIQESTRWIIVKYDVTRLKNIL